MLACKIDKNKIQYYKCASDYIKIFIQYNNEYSQTECYYSISTQELLNVGTKLTERQKDILKNKIIKEVEICKNLEW